MDGRRDAAYADGSHSLEQTTLDLAKSMSLTMSLSLETVFDSFCKAPYTEMTGVGGEEAARVNANNCQQERLQQWPFRSSPTRRQGVNIFSLLEPSTAIYDEQPFAQTSEPSAFKGASTPDCMDYRCSPLSSGAPLEPSRRSTNHSLSSTGTGLPSWTYNNGLSYDAEEQPRVRVQSPSALPLFKGPPPVQTGTSEWDTPLDLSKFNYAQQTPRDAQICSAFEMASRDITAKDRLVDELRAQMNLLKAEKNEALEQLNKLRGAVADKDRRITDLEWDSANASAAPANPPTRDEARRTGVFTPHFDFNPNTPVVVCLPTGQTRTITVEQGAKLPWEAFVQLYTHHINIATQLYNRRPLLPNTTEIHLYESLGNQLSLLLICQCISVPRNMYQAICAKIQEEVCYARPPKALWLRIAEDLGLTIQQQQALLVHRRDYQSTIQKVLHSRAAITAEFGTSSADPIESSIQALALPYLRLHGHMQSLKENLDQGHALTSTFASWVMHECFTGYQLTTLFVRAFPFVPDVLSIANAVAQRVGEPDAPPLHPGSPVQIARRSNLLYTARSSTR